MHFASSVRSSIAGRPHVGQRITDSTLRSFPRPASEVADVGVVRAHLLPAPPVRHPSVGPRQAEEDYGDGCEDGEVGEGVHQSDSTMRRPIHSATGTATALPSIR